MAYLKTLRYECDSPGCKKPATVEVINRVNAPCGSYCASHGSVKLKAAQKSEDGDAR